tara:strand:+ start:546 stop:1328 length:783 start_codon:yes stop_codon:yes gene_type:complete
MLLADSCFNITHESFNSDLDDVMKSANKSGIEYFFTPAARESDANQIIKLSEEYKNIYFALGIHPHHASELRPHTISNIKKLLEHSNAKAVGEIGLDYYRNFQSKDVQIKCFENFLELSVEIQKPAFLHLREAFHDFKPIVLNQLNNLPRSIVHCFTGSKKELTEILDMGMYIGITGWLCDLKRGENLRKILQHIPLESLIIETDAPYLVPKNLEKRPKNNRNEPKYLAHVCLTISELLNIPAEKIAEQTTSNFKNLFRI